MLARVQVLFRQGWAAFRLRRDLPWVLFLGGLLLTAHSGGGCLATGLLWLGGWVLFWRGFLWVWRKLLFRVSRRLWVILALMSVLPVLGLGVLLTATSWLGLGAQVSRATQQNLLAWQEALSLALDSLTRKLDDIYEELAMAREKAEKKQQSIRGMDPRCSPRRRRA